MFAKIRQRFRDMGTIKVLCLGAEKHASANGQTQPGAEHFVLAALDLPDGTARKVFERVRVAPDGFRAAIMQQYEDAIRDVGIELPRNSVLSTDTAPVPSGTGIYRAQPSAQALMEQLSRQRNIDSNAPLSGAHVIAAVTSAQFGVAVRALRTMGVDVEKLNEAAAAEIDAIHSA